MANWVLKFISGKYQGGEFPLEETHEYYIGRSSESDMVLVEDMVSRQHARLSVKDDVVLLEDLGSTNGSFVNGERVNTRDLESGDRILFGTSIIKLMRSEGAVASSPFDKVEDVSVKQTRAMPKVVMPREPTPGAPPPAATMAGAMTGLLEQVSLPDLLQLFSTSRKDGVLRLHDEPRRATLYLREGRVVFAEIAGVPDLPPDKAAFRAMAWTKGMFVLEGPSDREFEEEIEMSTEGMMMEAMRLMDELENVRHKLPSMETTFQLKQPLTPPLRGLTPELLDTLQLVINFRLVASVLDATIGADLETLQDIEYLLSNDYIEEV
jgi:pSer/pThr/pTyr-binding forkhead associated (FHA) protein